jgi:indole-3-glycerol phosphate synthase
MDWRRLEAVRVPAPATPPSEIRPSARDFTRHLGIGRGEITIVPLILRADPEGQSAWAPIDDLVAFAQSADALEISGLAVATEPSAFGGRLQDLCDISAAVTAPVLRYDCVADERRLYESRAAGADAVLVPVAVAGDRLPELLEIARVLHVAVVAEIADAAECRTALAAGAPVIAIPTDCVELARDVPARHSVLVVGGAAEPGDLTLLRGLADGVLLGRAILGAADPLERLAAFVDAADALGPAT